MVSQFADALWVPAALKYGKRFVDRIDSIAELARPLLGIDRAKGEGACIRLPMPADRDRCFVTKSPDDTLFFPPGHPRGGQSRYRWEPPDARGIELGFLVEAT